MIDDKAQEQIRDIILVLNQIVKRQSQQGIRLPDDIGESMKRLGASLFRQADLSARRLEDLKLDYEPQETLQLRQLSLCAAGFGRK